MYTCTLLCISVWYVVIELVLLKSTVVNLKLNNTYLTILSLIIITSLALPENSII